mgnify:CR=1 FL=1
MPEMREERWREIARWVAEEVADDLAVEAIMRELRTADFADEIREELRWMAATCDSYQIPRTVRRCVARAKDAISAMIARLLSR